MLHVILYINIHTYFKRTFLRLPMLSPRAKGNLPKTPTPRHEKPSELLVKNVQKTPKTYSLLLLPWGNPQRYKVSKSLLLLKTPYISEIGPRKLLSSN